MTGSEGLKSGIWYSPNCTGSKSAPLWDAPTSPRAAPYNALLAASQRVKLQACRIRSKPYTEGFRSSGRDVSVKAPCSDYVISVVPATCYIQHSRASDTRLQGTLHAIVAK
jgi:hypothetical protein